jgi:hypothetical protein
MKKDPVLKLIIIYILSVLGVLAAGLLFSSCTATKLKSNTKTDSTALQKLDSGAVKKATSETNSQWQREVFLYDTGKQVNNNYITQPIMYIRESGQQQQKSNNSDSTWKNKYDSLALTKQETTVEKKTTVLNPWQIIAISIGACLILILLINYLNKFKIVKT